MTRAQAITTLGLVHIYRSEGQDVAALSGVDLSVTAGEVIGLLGPSGSGKSTLLALLGGLFRPSAGKIFVGDHELSALTPTQLDAFQARETSLMLQGAQRNLIPYLTVRENVEFAQVEARRLGADVIGVERGLDLVGATEFADARLGHLSQGQLQMAALAVAMAPSPGVLLADEPTSALDRVARERILDTPPAGQRGTGHDGGGRHPRPRGRRPPAADGDDPRRPDRRRGPQRQGVCGRDGGRVHPHSGAHPGRAAAGHPAAARAGGGGLPHRSRGARPGPRLRAGSADAELSMSSVPVRLTATNVDEEDTMQKYVMVIYQGSAPLAGSAEWAAMSEQEQQQVGRPCSHGFGRAVPTRCCRASAGPRPEPGTASLPGSRSPTTRRWPTAT